MIWLLAFLFRGVYGNRSSDYTKTRLLTFDDIELQKGSLLQIFTRKGEDESAIDFNTAVLYQKLYWGFSDLVWSIPHSSYELMRRSAFICGGLLSD